MTVYDNSVHLKPSVFPKEMEELETKIKKLRFERKTVDPEYIDRNFGN